METKGRAYAYRWVILAIYFLLTVVIEIQWLTFAPIAREARIAYGASGMQIDLLAAVYLVTFIVFCIPASWVIDTYGIKMGVGLGAIITGVFSLLKGFFADSYPMMLICQVMLGIAQPFITNAVTKIAVRWFPIGERATAVGLGTLAQFVGFLLVNMVTPYLIIAAGDSFDLRRMLMTWGVLTAAASVLFMVLIQEAPPTPPSPGEASDRLLSMQGLKHLLGKRDMIILMFLFFAGLGIFNAIATCIDQISEIKKLATEQTGMLMGSMLIAGIAGAVVLPLLSDLTRRRKPFVIASLILLTPGIAGMTFGTGYGFILASAAVFGFFLLGGAGPIGFQYAAEVCNPAPESMSQGIILLMGQISGIIFVVLMNGFGVNGSMLFFLGLGIASIVLSLFLTESPLMRRTAN